MLKSQKIATAIAVVAALLMSNLTINAQNNRGYKGMFNAGWILLSEDVSFEALTIHGYQINPHLFVGGVQESTITHPVQTMLATSPFSRIFVDISLKGESLPMPKPKLADR